MSISVYAGLPRSGKSYSVVEVMIEAIKVGRDVYTNIPLNADVWLQEFGSVPVVFDSQDVLDNPRWFEDVLPVGALLVLDECWRFWPAGLKATNVDMSQKEFLAMHGHKVNEAGVTTQVILVTQDLAQLSAFVRQLVDKTFRCVKLDAVGQDNRFRVDVYQGAVTGQNPPQSNRLNEIYYKYKPDVYRFYKSSTHSKAGDAGNEKRIDERANLLKSNKMKALIAGMVLMPIVAIVLGVIVYNKFHKKPEQSVVIAPVSSSVPVLAPKPKLDGFLHGKTLSIAFYFNDGNISDWRVRVSDGDFSTKLDPVQLVQLGYSTNVINPCLFELKGHAEVLYVMCEDEKKQSILAGVFSPPPSDKASM